VKSQSITKTVTVTHRDKRVTPLPVLIPATPQQYDDGKYDGGKCGIPINLKWLKECKKPLDLLSSSKPVVVVGGKNLNGDKLISAAKKSMGSNWQRFVATVQIRDGHENGDSYSIRNALSKLRGNKFTESWRLTLGLRSFPVLGLPTDFARAMKRSQIVLWWTTDRMRLEPAIFCETLNTAMYVKAALRYLRACPCCDQPFVPDRPDRQFCTVPCRERFRKRRQRANSKSRREKL
jgi:hypothetical protein